MGESIELGTILHPAYFILWARGDRASVLRSSVFRLHAINNQQQHGQYLPATSSRMGCTTNDTCSNNSPRIVLPRR